jgi:hypothetical protein
MSSNVSPQQNEPSLQAPRSPPEDRLNDLYERAESLLTSIVALFLIGFVIVSLIAVIWEVKDPLFTDHDFTAATLKGIDLTFLAIILLELLHTTLSRGPISQQLQEFLVIGITATVRHGLGIAATRGDPRDVVINLTINSGGALLLVGALWLARRKEMQGPPSRAASISAPSRVEGAPGPPDPSGRESSRA